MFRADASAVSLRGRHSANPGRRGAGDSHVVCVHPARTPCMAGVGNSGSRHPLCSARSVAASVVEKSPTKCECALWLLKSHLAELLGHAMPVVKHPIQSWLQHPAEEHIDELAAGQLILHAVGEACLAVDILKLVPVDPFGERSLDLFVYEKTVLLICRVLRDPGK